MVGEEEECVSTMQVKAKVRISFVVCVLFKEVIYSSTYRDSTTGTCWEAPQKKTAYDF